MASLPIIGAASTSFAAQGKNAELIAKGSLAKAGLRTRSKKDVITGKRIPGSSSNRFLQLIGQEKKEDAENTIREAEKASSKEKGMIFVFNLLLQTLEEIKRIWDEGRRNYGLDELIEELNLEKKESKLLYIIVYSSALTEKGATEDMRNLLKRIKSDFGFPTNSAAFQEDPTNDSEMYYIRTHGLPYDHLVERIQLVKSYIALWEEKVDTAKRTVLDEFVERAAATRKSKYGRPRSSSIAAYDGVRGVVGPYAHIADYLPDTEKHEERVINKLERRVKRERAEQLKMAQEDRPALKKAAKKQERQEKKQERAERKKMAQEDRPALKKALQRRKEREEWKKRREEEESEATVLLQARLRGHKVRKDMKKKRREAAAEKFRRGYEARRRADAIRIQKLTPEQAADLPADFGRALNTTNGGRRRKKKTRKKRGGMEAPPTPPRPPKDNDVGTNKYVPGHVGFHPPQQLPHFMLPPPVNPEPVTRRRDRRDTAIEMERAPLDMRIPEEERDVRVNTANQRYRRSQRSHLRNFTGDVLESCTGSRCGLGGSRRRKSRKKKKKKKKKKTRKKKRKTLKKKRKRRKKKRKTRR